MKLSYNRLKTFVDLPEPEKLSEVLATRAFEVEWGKPIVHEFSEVFAARVLEVEKHPNADRLRVVKLQLADSVVEPVVCGAFNFEVGDVVPLALPGAYIPKNIHSETAEGFTLGQATIRGVTSQGMICAKFELGLSDDKGDGIWVLPSETEIGLDLRSLLDDDYLFDVSLPANRPDLFSHSGIAREIAAVLNIPYKESKLFNLSKIKTGADLFLPVSSDFACAHGAVIFKNVKVTRSPLWLEREIELFGAKPQNLWVDLTNWITLVWGQPLHVFDANSISGLHRIRWAHPSEKIKLLNGNSYELNSEVMVIADDAGPLDVAGVMGGDGSKVTFATTDVLLVATNFNATLVRKSSRLLGVRTDAVMRFEKGLNPKLVELGLARYVSAVEELAENKPTSIQLQASEVPESEIVVECKISQIENLLGLSIEPKVFSGFLKSFGYSSEKSSDTFLVTPPWYRSDVSTVPDLADDYLRFVGLDTINPVPVKIASSIVFHEKFYDFSSSVKELLARLGFLELFVYRFVSGSTLKDFGLDPATHIKIANPLSSELEYLTQTPIVPLLRLLPKFNLQNQTQVFTISKGFFGYESEKDILSVVVSELISPESALSVLKGRVFDLMKMLGLVVKEGLEIESAGFGEKIKLFIGGEKIGEIGVVLPKVVDLVGAKGNVAWCDLDLRVLSEIHLKSEKVYVVPNEIVSRDLSVVVSREIAFQKIREVVRDVSLEVNVDLVDSSDFHVSGDEFHDNLKNNGKTNLVLRFGFSRDEKEPEPNSIQPRIDAIIKGLEDKVGAIIR